MNATTATATAERTATHTRAQQAKPNSGQAQPGQFAALLMQADDELGVEAGPLNAATPSENQHTDDTTEDREKRAMLSGELALLGLMSWRATGMPTLDMPTQPSAPLAPATLALSTPPAATDDGLLAGDWQPIAAGEESHLPFGAELALSAAGQGGEPFSLASAPTSPTATSAAALQATRALAGQDVDLPQPAQGTSQQPAMQATVTLQATSALAGQDTDLSQPAQGTSQQPAMQATVTLQATSALAGQEQARPQPTDMNPPPTAPDPATNPARSAPAVGAAGANPAGLGGAKAKLGSARLSGTGQQAANVATGLPPGGATPTSTVSLAARAGANNDQTTGFSSRLLAAKAGNAADTGSAMPSPPLESALAATSEAPKAVAPATNTPADASTSGAGPSSAEAATPAQPTTDAQAAAPTPDTMERTMAQLSAQMSYWAAQGSQRANLTIAGENNQPIDVSVSFEKGEVSVHFETDEASLRDALAQGGDEVLQRMLEAKGMTLGNVSVGAGQADGRQSPPPETPQTPAQGSGSRTAVTQPGTDNTGSAPAPRHRPIISANKLDLFA